MPHLATYLSLAHHAEQTLASSLRTVGAGHAAEVEVYFTCQVLATMSEKHVERLAPVAARYGEQRYDDDVEEPERLHADGLGAVRDGAVGLLRDLQDLHLLANLVHTTWTVLRQGAQGLHDNELTELATSALDDTGRQLAWFTTQIKAAAPQALLTSP